MKLLLVTQRIDEADANLAVHARWLSEFALRTKSVEVIAQAIGSAPSLSNVTLHSLGKERGKNKLLQALKLIVLLPGAVKRADAVLVLMVPLYVIAVWPWAVFYRKPVYLWYTHKHVSRTLKLAVKLATGIFSASKDSFRLGTPKVRFLGHAIDTEFFRPSDGPRDPGLLITVGRIASVKRLELMIEAVKILRAQGKNVRIQIIGEPILEADKRYADKLRAEAPDFAEFVGSLKSEQVALRYQQAFVCLNASATGSLDKAVLEAMACGCQVVTTNEAFRELVPEGFVSEVSAQAFADRVVQILADPVPGEELRQRILRDHDMKTTLGKLLERIEYGLRKVE